MGKKEIIDLIVDGGSAKAGPAMGTKLGPLGLNMGQILQKINEKTKDFSGMKVPIKLIVDIETKTFEIEVGTPSTSQLIKTELKAQKGSGKAGTEFIGELKKEQLEKIAKIKMPSSTAPDLNKAVRQVLGTCVSMGVKIEGKTAKEYLKSL